MLPVPPVNHPFFFSYSQDYALMLPPSRVAAAANAVAGAITAARKLQMSLRGLAAATNPATISSDTNVAEVTAAVAAMSALEDDFATAVGVSPDTAMLR